MGPETERVGLSGPLGVIPVTCLQNAAIAR